MRWAAMLRGINLGKRQLKSAELKAVVEGLGFTAVTPVLASGNVVFEAGDAAPEAIERDLHAALERATGLRSGIFVRSGADLYRVIAANPFPDAARDRPSFLTVTFHKTAVDPVAIAAVAAGYDGPERMVAIGRELFTDFPGGQGRSKLIPLLRRAKLAHGNTARNWNTVCALANILGGPSATPAPSA